MTCIPFPAYNVDKGLKPLNNIFCSILHRDSEFTQNLGQNPVEVVPDSFQSFLVNGANFTDREEYPIIPQRFVSSAIPQKIMPFNKAITFRGDLHDTFISFYSPDETFERVRRTPKRYLSFFQRTAGLIGPDFSIHSDMPLIKQKSQINDNLSLTYYYGSQGIPIIPNLRCGTDELLPEFLAAIPCHRLVAIGTHGFVHQKHEQCEWYCFIESFCEKLKPAGIIVYGTLRNKMFEELKNSYPFFFYEPWICQRAKGGRLNGN